MQTSKSRICAFDPLRATMMLLVVVAHSGITYAVTSFGRNWPIKDPHSNNALFDVLVLLTQTFCMPILFVVTGFFTAMLFVERGSQKMLANRVKRIVLPFVTGLLILYPVVITAGSYFLLTASGHTNTFSASVGDAYNHFAWKNVTTMHLWFLYDLSFFCIGAWAISLLCEKISPKIFSAINLFFRAVFRLKPAPILFAVITYLLLCAQEHGFIETHLGFSINIGIFSQYACFFGFGWLLYYQKQYLGRFKKADWFSLVTGIILFIIHLAIFVIKPGIEKTSGLYLFAALNAASIWLVLFGTIGLFLRFFNTYSPVTRYISDASYWIYLVHLPMAIFFQATLINFFLNPFFKFLIVISATFVVTLVTYNFMVRNTFIGKFLNGRKYAPGLSKSGHAVAV